MILTPEPARHGSAAGRLLRALELRGWPQGAAGPAAADAITLFLCPAPGESGRGAIDWLREQVRASGTRLLVVTRLGAHPDAHSAGLRDCWAMEEAARASGLSVLTLRLGPLLGPEAPLWMKLRSAPKMPRRGTGLLNPVTEADAVEALDRALAGRAEWRGWYEVAGPEAWSLAELVELARESGPSLAEGAGAWEPPLEEMAEHRLADAGPWLAHFGQSVRPLAEQVRSWRRAAERSEQ